MGPIHDDNENFLQLYLNYTRAQESPELFHLWTGTTILAAALGRKCWINRGYYRLYPNLFCILVAGSAKCRKSTAVNIGVRLLTDIDTTKRLVFRQTVRIVLAPISSSIVQTFPSSLPSSNTANHLFTFSLTFSIARTSGRIRPRTKEKHSYTTSLSALLLQQLLTVLRKEFPSLRFKKVLHLA